MTRSARLNRRGDVFMLLLDILFLVAIILIIWRIAGAFEQKNSEEGIGTRQVALLSTYAESEKMLLYLDTAARYAVGEAYYTLYGTGAIAANSDCGPYATYARWSSEKGFCGPKAESASTEGKPADGKRAEDPKVVFARELQRSLRNLLKYPGMPAPTYTFEITDDNGLVIRGIPDQEITLPIVTAKGTSQLAATAILRSQQAGLSTTKTDTTLQASMLSSANHEPRTGPVDTILILATGTTSLAEAKTRYIDGIESVHYVIDMDGAIYQLVPEGRRALALTCAEKSDGCTEPSIEQRAISIALVNPLSAGTPMDGKTCPSPATLLAKTQWCTIEVYNKIPCPTTLAECWAPYTDAQLLTLQLLTIDIASRRSIKENRIFLEEQVRAASANPGPALVAKGMTQQGWFADLKKQVIAETSRIASASSLDDEGRAQKTEVAKEENADAIAPIPGLAVSLPVENNVISSCWGDRTLHDRKDKHDGLDFGVAKGTSVKTIADGTVLETCEEWVGTCACSILDKSNLCPGCKVIDGRVDCTNSPCRGRCSNFGNTLVVDHGSGMFSRYSHLSDVTVAPGTRLTRGTEVGKSGNTGASGGPHLDLKIYTNNDRKAEAGKNPLCFYPDSLIQRLTTRADSCKKYSSFSHSDPALQAECAGIQSMSDLPLCAIGILPNDPGGSQKVSVTIERLSKHPDALTIIDKTAKEKGIDPLLVKALIVQESTGDAHAVNNLGYVGLGQMSQDAFREGGGGTTTFASCDSPKGIQDGTKIEGCIVKGVMDDRLNSTKNAKAATGYLSIKIGEFKGYTDQIMFGVAAYNAGAGTMQKVLDAAKQGTGKKDPRFYEAIQYLTPEIMQSVDICDTPTKCDAKLKEIREYAPSVMAHYARLGGNAASAYGDQTCNDVTLKEIGSYAFNPSFTTTAPDLLTALDRASAFAKDVYTTCDGAGEAPESCFAKKRAEFNDKSNDFAIVDCATLSDEDAIVLGINERMTDCKESPEQGCACALPVFSRDTRVILYNTYPSIAVDGVELTAQGSGAPSASFMKPDGTIIAGSVELVQEAGQRRYDVRATKAQPKANPYPTTAPFLLNKDGGKLVWGESTLAQCMPYKTTYPVCMRLKQPLYVLSQGKEINPTLKFALRVQDKNGPGEVRDAIMTNTMFAAVSFSPPSDSDVSHYVITCTAAGMTITQRQNSTEPTIIKSCGSAPLTQEFTVTITPVDLRAQEGPTTTCSIEKDDLQTFMTGGIDYVKKCTTSSAVI